MFPSIWWQLKLLEFFLLISWHRFFNNKRYTYLPWGRIALSSACSSSHSPTYSLSTVKHRTVFLASCWSFSLGNSDFLSIVAFSVLLLTEIKSADWRIWLVQFMINLSWISTYEKHETICWLAVTTGNYLTITNYCAVLNFYAASSSDSSCTSLQASSPIWGSEVSLARTRERGAACSQATLALAQKPFRIGLLFTHNNGDFGVISITEWSCAAPISKVEQHISDRFCATLWCNVNRYSDCSGSE